MIIQIWVGEDGCQPGSTMPRTLLKSVKGAIDEAMKFTNLVFTARFYKTFRLFEVNCNSHVAVLFGHPLDEFVNCCEWQ